MTPSSEPAQPAQERQSQRGVAHVRPHSALYRLLFGLTGLSLLIGLLLVFGASPQQQQSWPVAALMNVTFVVTLVGFFLLVFWDIATQRPWWTRILPTIGVMCGSFFIGYLTLLEPLVPPSIRWLEPALNSLWIVALVCLVIGSEVSSRARRRASR